MEEHKYDYQIEIDEKDKQNIIKALFKIIEEKAKKLEKICCDGRISGQVYDCETEAMYVILNDIWNARDTLALFKNLEKGKG